MKLKQIATAISAVLLSSSAFALTPTTVPDITIFMSGASAQDKAIGMLFKDICAVDSATGLTDLDIYKDNVNPAKPGKAYTSYFCTVDNVKAGFPATDTTVRKVLFNKRSKGGSGEGVNPVLDEVAIDAMNINNNNCSKTAGESFYRCDITALDPTTGLPTNNLIKVVSDAGVSDVNPEMFVGQNTPTGNTPVNAGAVSQKMIVKSAAAAVFGIPVTTTLRNALQEAEFPGNTACTTNVDANGDGILDRETEACMPSLTKRQVASLATGMIKNWSAFKVNGVALTSVASIVPASTKVTFCRRVNGSGTQAQMNANFLHYPCTANAVAAASTGNPYIGPIVVQNEGSGDMSVCLNDFNNGTNGTGQNFDILASGPVTAWAFGLQSTEKNGNLKDDYRFIKIDGVAPTIQNAANGKYLDWAEQTFQWRKPAYNGPTGDKLTVISTIASTASNPATIGSLDTKLVQTWGQGGYLAVSTNFAPAANGILDITAPVIPYTHAASGQLDNCTVPLLNSQYQSPQL